MFSMRGPSWKFFFSSEEKTNYREAITKKIVQKMQTMQQVSAHLRCCTWTRIRDLERTQISHSRDDEALQRGDVRVRTLPSKAQVPQRPTGTIIVLREVTRSNSFNLVFISFCHYPLSFWSNRSLYSLHCDIEIRTLTTSTPHQTKTVGH